MVDNDALEASAERRASSSLVRGTNCYELVKMLDFKYSGLENKETCSHLGNGEVCKVTGIGNSMTPLLKSRQSVICVPVTEETPLAKKDIVLCKVRGRYYLHLIHGIKNDSRYLIGNNHGHMNGWIGREHIYGKVVEKL